MLVVQIEILIWFYHLSLCHLEVCIPTVLLYNFIICLDCFYSFVFICGRTALWGKTDLINNYVAPSPTTWQF